MVSVHNVPWFWLPFFWLYGYGLGGAVYVLLKLIRLTCRIEVVGAFHRDAHPGAIQALWHHNNVPYFVVFSGLGNHVWMNHPAWYMKAVHVMIKLMGVKKIAFGSTGNSGKKAAEEVTAFLKKGYGTFINPDGPAGPPEKLKKGVLHMSLQSGVPVLPVIIETPVKLRIPSWDGKRLPLPFSTIRVIYQKPLWVTDENFASAEMALAKSLSFPESDRA